MYKGIIVTYNPDSAVKNHISALVKQESSLVIVDNGSSGITSLSDFTGGKAAKSVTFIKLDKNYGLAYAQNRGIDEAIKQKAKYIFLLDQDSELPEDYFENMISFYKKWNKQYKIGIVAPNFYDPHIKLYTRYAKLTRFSYKHVQCGNDDLKDVSFAVASGSMIPATVIRDAGLMRNEFFIDHVDSEYSLRLIKLNYKILVNCRITMNHSIGERTIHKLLGMTIKPNHHGPFRKYYIFRNGFRLFIEYGWRYPGFAVMMINRMIHDILGIVFFETNKFAKLVAVGRGVLASFLRLK